MSEDKNLGWVKLHRALLRWEWYQDANTMRLFIHLLLRANHQPTKWRGIEIGKGLVLSGRKKLARELGLSEQQIRTSIKHLQSTNELTIKSTKEYTLFKVNNWKDYQQTNQQSNPQSTNDQPTPNHKQEGIKNDKNEKNNIYINGQKKKKTEKRETIPFLEIISCLNKATDKDFKTTEANKSKITARWNEGFRAADFKKVIEIKSSGWKKDPKMNKYLRPETLFGTKFESYLNEKIIKRKPLRFTTTK